MPRIVDIRKITKAFFRKQKVVIQTPAKIKSTITLKMNVADHISNIICIFKNQTGFFIKSLVKQIENKYVKYLKQNDHFKYLLNSSFKVTIHLAFYLLYRRILNQVNIIIN